MEQTAYQHSSTRDTYDAACASGATEGPQTAPNGEAAVGTTPLLPGDIPDDTGIRIGSYYDCSPVSGGVTSQVYRSGNKALKVIVAYQNLEPHNPHREVKILRTLQPPCISLLHVFRDQEQRLVLLFPYMPLTLAQLLDKSPALSKAQIRAIFSDTLLALQAIHGQDIIHRDMKPSAVLLSSPSGPAFLSDFGTAWHPEFSAHSEPPSEKILDIGTGPYRAPEVLFGNKSYDAQIDMWGAGVMLAEAIRSPPSPLFESRAVHEDGNQLGLILSIFKTLGTPTPETWPEAKEFKVTPFEMWTVFAPRPWDEILPGLDPAWRELVAALVRYDGSRATSEQALKFKCFTDSGGSGE